MRSDECVALLRSRDGPITLIGRDGSWIELEPAKLRSGDDLLAEIETRVPDERVVPVEDADGSSAVEAVAREKLKRRGTVSEEVELLPRYLAPGEKLLTLAEATRGLKTGLVTVTDRRVIFLSAGFTGRRRDFLELPYEAIRSAQARRGIPGLAGARVVFHTSGNEVKVGGVVRRERAVEIAEYVRSHAAAPSG